MSRDFQDNSADAQSTPQLDLPVEGVDFARGEWKDKVRFQCLHCPWDTLHPDQIITHYQRHKPVKPAVDRPIEATLFDGDGRLIDRIQIVGKPR